MRNKLTVIYDDECPTCRIGKNFAERYDRRKTIEFVGMNTERGKALIEEHRLDMNESAYAFHEDGSRTSKSQMILDVLSRNGTLGFLLSLPYRIPYLSDKLYDLLARHRKQTTKKGI